MKLFQKVFAGGLLFVAFGGVFACGSDDEGGGSAAKLESCKKVCEKSATASCVITIPVDDCKALCDVYGQASASCQDALKAFSDCQLASADVCTAPGCDAQLNAQSQACK